jgi:predicted GNAT family acetyltransferase
MTITYQDNLTDVDWNLLKTNLAADRFDNGRSPIQLKQSFQNSYAVCLAWHDSQFIGTARVLSDGVCNAYLVDMWTSTAYRRQGIATAMLNRLCRVLSGQHLYLQVDPDTSAFYRQLGFVEQPLGMSRTIGKWLVKDQT